MAEASLKLGGDWATKEGSLLGFNDQNGNYKPIPFDFTRATTATRVNRDGLIEEVQSGVPRIDFLDNPDGALKLEPQRTNLITYSEDISNSVWTTLSSGETIVSNSVVSPDGTQNADTLEGDGTSTNVYIRQDITLTTSIDYTFSIFAKKGTNNFLAVSAEGFTGATNTLLIFDLNNSIVTTGTGNIEDYGNGWLKCSYTISISTDGVGRFLIYPSYNETTRAFPTASDANGQNIYLWGAQLEAGSYATSYIKTSGSAVTRNADACSATGISNVIGQSEGVIFMDFIWDNSTAASADYPIMVYGSDASNFVGLNTNTNTNQMLVYSGGAVVAAIGGGDFVVGQRYKLAMAYKLNDFAYYINGEQKGTDTAGAIPIGLQSVKTETPFGSKKTGQKTKEIIFYNERLTNTELAELTTI